MANTGAAELLATWEAGLAEAPTGRALLLHRAARPDVGAASLPVLPVGEREADLFALRRALFGERMQVRLGCSACGEDMEFDLDAGEFARSLGHGGSVGGGDSSAGPDPSAGAVVRVRQDGWDVAFRLPGVADLTAAARAADPRAALLARCVVSATRDGAAVAAGDLPVPVQRRIAEAVEAADPGADVTLNVGCPECGAATRAELDIASYLWTELDAWARDLLLDVHLLATSYGWSEPEILALSPLRRRYYLELCADV
ncbi:hypothetical protein EJ357_05615 [Streptomyces cyaneochromogenes]|uniref:Phage baseplate protein n=1 Tax=Streptomyces cyaneochromogenes TaxID=2496836 RepID=A0A3S9M1G2_9ACTN|nr:hypothetical protein [Streptomyces cyaneochromogenes]AZQ32992.1 hypothetical protein EJ357_05615 [Streptomyces cyaneochromogenes]